MKKAFAAVLAAIMMIQCAVPSFAADMGTLAKSTSAYSTVNTSAISKGMMKPAAFKYNGLDFSPVFNATYYLSKYSDLKKAFGNDSTKAFNHFITFGIKEGRQASAAFSINIYKSNYVDLRNAFGSDNMSYVKHYLQYGIREKRVANTLIAGATTTTKEEALARELLDAINTERRSRGLRVLTSDAKLTSAASVRAKEASSYWSHTRPNGTSYKTVSSAVAAENLASGFTTGKAVSNAWVNHSGHRETMLGGYNKVGISVYISQGICYYAAEFGY